METIATPVLRLEKLVLGFPGTPLTTSPITFPVPAHTLVALIGRNGAGKTTLLKALLGEPVRLSGAVRLPNGQDTASLNAKDRAHYFSFVPQEHQFPWGISVRGFLGLAFLPHLGWASGLSPQQKTSVAQTLSQFSLGEMSGRSLDQLSSGERQRVFLARAVLQGSEILVLDEPTNHLDPAAALQFWNSVEQLRQKGSKTLIVSTHDLAFVRERADMVVGMEKGSVRFFGKRESVLSQISPLFE